MNIKTIVVANIERCQHSSQNLTILRTIKKVTHLKSSVFHRCAELCLEDPKSEPLNPVQA